MNPLPRHYHQLVGLNQDWVIADIQLDVRNKTLTLPLEFVGDHVVCPKCGAACSMNDHAECRQLRFRGPRITAGSLFCLRHLPSMCCRRRRAFSPRREAFESLNTIVFEFSFTAENSV
jgi:hypothetical protein